MLKVFCLFVCLGVFCLFVCLFFGFFVVVFWGVLDAVSKTAAVSFDSINLIQSVTWTASPPYQISFRSFKSMRGIEANRFCFVQTLWPQIKVLKWHNLVEVNSTNWSFFTQYGRMDGRILRITQINMQLVWIKKKRKYNLKLMPSLGTELGSRGPSVLRCVG